ncbi:phosphatase [Lactobacillus panisapium]|uniref:phosphatase n=1 Tax=Lactobacillus TaxID=1578 RepID=UPI000CDB1805|nr:MULTISPECIES: phosphatase [Lactobacillus]MCX8725063.1 phosphatase [Lactobacillus sp. B4007]QYN53938.1 phosphatase [Lactobacillus panisapium]
MLQAKIDTHTHTLASVHAYSTVMENVQVAKEKGLTGLVVTDHAPGLGTGETFPTSYFGNMRKAIPKVVNGIRVFKGIETSITDYNGNIDMPTYTLNKLDIVIASCHEKVLKPATNKEHDQIWEAVAKNPWIDIIGHCGNDNYAFSHEKIIKLFKRYHKIVEINSSSFPYRKNARKNCRDIALLCKKYGVRVTISSDAHFASNIGNFTDALKMLEEIDFPQELIVNRDLETFSSAFPRIEK